MLVNAALDVAPALSTFRKVVAEVLVGIERFFQTRSEPASHGTISRTLPAGTLAQIFSVC